MSLQPVSWDQQLIEKYNHAGPRYTSYPTAFEFSDNYVKQTSSVRLHVILNVRYRSTFTSRSAISSATSAAATKSSAQAAQS